MEGAKNDVTCPLRAPTTRWSSPRRLGPQSLWHLSSRTFTQIIKQVCLWAPFHCRSSNTFNSFVNTLDDNCSLVVNQRHKHNSFIANKQQEGWRSFFRYWSSSSRTLLRRATSPLCESLGLHTPTSTPASAPTSLIG